MTTDAVIKKPWGEMVFSNDPYISDPNYECDFFEFVKLQNWKENPLVCYDLGAHQGLWTCFLSTFRPNTVVHAFEPFPLNYSYLLKNVSALKLSNVVCHQFGVGGFDGIFDFWQYDLDHTNDTTGGSLVQRGEHRTSIQVDIKRLDSLNKFGIPQPNFIKMDVEYKEFETLLGMGDMLKGNNLKMLIELHGGKENEERISMYLQSFDFQLIKLSRGFWCHKD